jgi:hypothetical protein
MLIRFFEYLCGYKYQSTGDGLPLRISRQPVQDRFLNGFVAIIGSVPFYDPDIRIRAYTFNK